MQVLRASLRCAVIVPEVDELLRLQDEACVVLRELIQAGPGADATRTLEALRLHEDLSRLLEEQARGLQGRPEWHEALALHRDASAALAAELQPAIRTAEPPAQERATAPGAGSAVDDSTPADDRTVVSQDTVQRGRPGSALDEPQPVDVPRAVVAGLSAERAPRRRREARRRWMLPLAAGIAALMLVGGVGAGALRVQSMLQQATEARAHLSSARSVLAGAAAAPSLGGSVTIVAEPAEGTSGAVGDTGASLLSLQAACASTTSAHNALQDLSGQVQLVMPLVGALEHVPGMGSHARSQVNQLDLGTHLASAGASLCEGLGPLAGLLGAGGADAGSARGAGGVPAADLLRSLARSRPALLRAIADLEQVERSLEEIDASTLDDEARQSLGPLRERVPKLRQTLGDTAALLSLLGSGEPRRFLLVSQNSDELRATGGFIGTAGLVEAHDGTVRLLDYGTSRRYNTPFDVRAVPPEPFRRYLTGNYWHFAAANWWPSFPDAARQMEYFYSLTVPQQPVDGVIALDQYGMARFLEVLGEVEVPEYGEVVTAENLHAKLDAHIHDYTQADSTRKQFAAALSQAVLEGMLEAPSDAVGELVQAVAAGFEAQQLLVWVKDAEAAGVLSRRHWDGHLLEAPSDYLMLVDTEVRSTKHSQEVRREATYEVRLQPTEGPPRARLAVTYTNESKDTGRPGARFVPEYGTFVRAYVPSGATLVRADGFEAGTVVAYEECGRTVLGGEAVVLAGTSTTVAFEYDLPGRIATRPYELVLQQQPGVPPGSLRATVEAAGETLVAEQPNLGGGHARWRIAQGASSGTLQSAPVLEAEGRANGCRMDLVEAMPLAKPVQVQIPRIDLDAKVVELGIGADGVMEAPEGPSEAGWYRTSARAGAPGNSVLSGHVDATLLVVDAKQSRGRQASRSLQMLYEAGATVAGVVLNRVEEKALAYATYGYESAAAEEWQTVEGDPKAPTAAQSRPLTSTGGSA